MHGTRRGGALRLAGRHPGAGRPALQGYAAGLPVHCLPLYGQWHHARLDATKDLREEVPCRTFLALSAHALASVGVPVDGLGGHSFRRGRAVELFHGNAPHEAVTEVLRHRSAASTRPGHTSPMRLDSPLWQ
jgi:hypothetical protein